MGPSEPAAAQHRHSERSEPRSAGHRVIEGREGVDWTARDRGASGASAREDTIVQLRGSRFRRLAAVMIAAATLAGCVAPPATPTAWPASQVSEQAEARVR